MTETATIPATGSTLNFRCAETFRVLGSTSRLALLWEISRRPGSVTDLISATGMRPAIASRHLGEIRLAGLAVSVPSPSGRRRLYTLTSRGEKALAFALDMENRR